LGNNRILVILVDINDALQLVRTASVNLTNKLSHVLVNILQQWVLDVSFGYALS
jgi:hypothetical protein